MKRLLIFVFCFTVFINISFSKSPSDTIRSFSWTTDVTYLPTPYSANEKYSAKGFFLQHSLVKKRYLYGIDWVKGLRVLKKNRKGVRNSVDYILEHMNDSIFTVYLSDNDKAELIRLANKKGYKGVDIYEATENDVLKYIDSKDSILIELKEFNTEYSKYAGFYSLVIDGAPFYSSLTLKTKNKNEIEYKFSGNFSGGIDDTEVDEFLIFFHVCNTYNLFEKIGLKKHCSKLNLYEIILRYIAYKENLIDRENYEKWF